MIKILCDRCGRKITGKRLLLECHLQRDNPLECYDSVYQIDFCGDCKEDFEKFIREGTDNLPEIQHWHPGEKLIAGSEQARWLEGED